MLWHVHGSYTTAFVQGDHQYLVPVTEDRGPDGRGRARTWDWPASVVEVTAGECAETDIDVVILQRPEELRGLAARWLGGREPGVDVPAVYLEHNAPGGPAATSVHPAAERSNITVVHVTAFNALMWDSGRAPVRIVEHGIVDPGPLYSGELPSAAVVVNEPRRRGRTVGLDLLPALGEAVDIDVFGMGAAELGGFENLPQERLHREIARRRVYLHPVRWTSLGLALIEAMHLGMPVVALATTAVAEAVPPEAGLVTCDLRALGSGLRQLVSDHEAAAAAGRVARTAALRRFGLERFLRDWDRVLEEALG